MADLTLIIANEDVAGLYILSRYPSVSVIIKH